MAEEPVSRQELIRRRRGGGFVGRRRELAVFRENLARAPGADTYQFLFHIHGLAGVGKSTLTRRWEEVAREAGAATAVVGDDVQSAVEVMEAISGQLGRQGCALKSFDKHLVVYRQKRHEADAALAVRGAGDNEGGPVAPGGPGSSARRAEPSSSSVLVAQAGVAGLGLVPGVGAFSGAVRPEQMAAGLDRARATLGALLRSHDDVRLVLSPLKVLTPRFLTDLAEVAGRRPQVVLFFDTYERTASLLDVWLRDMLIAEAYGTVPLNVQAVLSGQGALNPACWGDSLDLVTEVALEPFAEDEARALLAARAVTDERVVQVILRLSGRLPVLLDALARSRPQDVDAVGDPSDTAVDRFLKWETDPVRRDTILACALPRRVDEDICRAIAPASEADGLRWLRALPFLTDQAGQYRYHDVIRAPMLRVQRSRSPARWCRDHAHLASVFGAWRRDREEGRSADEFWDDAGWREHRLDETYHLLCARGRSALPDALHDAVRACGHSVESLRRWARLFVQAGQDTDNTATDDLILVGSRLLECTGQAAPSGRSGVSALAVLLSTPGLGTDGRALAYALRGRRHLLDGRYDLAIADYDAALALEPNLARAHTGRGRTHQMMRLYEQALTDYDHAVRLDPHVPRHLIHRISAYYNLRRYEEALADADRVLGLDPHDSAAMMYRGMIRHRMHRHEQALEDLTHAITVDSGYAWAYAVRGDVRHTLGHDEDALADLDRSLTLDPHSPWPHCWRAEVYRALGRYEEALADFDKAVELGPACGWFPYQSALTMRLTGSRDEADRWQRALDIYEAQGVAGPGGTDLGRSNLLVVLCALPDWARAEEQLHRFLSHAPSRHQIAEALEDLADLADLQRAVGGEAGRLAVVVGRLRGALGPV